MRVEKVDKKVTFVPIAIILESQEEVDKLYGIFNFPPIVNCLGLKGWEGKLNEAYSGNGCYHKLLVKAFN